MDLIIVNENIVTFQAILVMQSKTKRTQQCHPRPCALRSPMPQSAAWKLERLQAFSREFKEEDKVYKCSYCTIYTLLTWYLPRYSSRIAMEDSNCVGAR